MKPTRKGGWFLYLDAKEAFWERLCTRERQPARDDILTFSLLAFGTGTKLRWQGLQTHDSLFTVFDLQTGFDLSLLPTDFSRLDPIGLKSNKRHFPTLYLSSRPDADSFCRRWNTQQHTVGFLASSMEYCSDIGKLMLDHRKESGLRRYHVSQSILILNPNE
jgi:hypothetical protein